jgi:hypothetical protein
MPHFSIGKNEQPVNFCRKHTAFPFACGALFVPKIRRDKSGFFHYVHEVHTKHSAVSTDIA